MWSLNPIERQMKIGVLAHLLILAMVAASARAATINFDENGNANMQSGANTIPIPSLGNQPDPFDPTNGLTPLVYDLTSIIGPVTAGDIGVIEIPGQLPPSDILRFYTNTALKSYLVVYSDRPEAGETPVPLADVGFPANGVLQTNRITLLETGPEAGPNGLFNYTPTAGQPGFVPTPPGPVTYNFLSDAAVPEPSGVAAIGLIAVAFFLRRPRRR